MNGWVVLHCEVIKNLLVILGVIMMSIWLRAHWVEFVFNFIPLWEVICHPCWELQQSSPRPEKLNLALARGTDFINSQWMYYSKTAKVVDQSHCIRHRLPSHSAATVRSQLSVALLSLVTIQFNELSGGGWLRFWPWQLCSTFQLLKMSAKPWRQHAALEIMTSQNRSNKWP